MDDVLGDLVSRDRDEAEEALRNLLATCNGLAGLFILRAQWPQAAAEYRRVLEAAAAHAGVCSVDALQQLHALVNLGAWLRSALLFFGYSLP